MDAKGKIYAAAFGIILLMFAAGMLAPQEQQVALWISGFGLLALVSLIFVVALPIVARISRHPFALKALSLQRQIGICVFLFALVHVLLVLHFALGWDLSLLLVPEAVFVLFGVVAFAILAAMAVTSNDFSVKAMGRNWKRVQMLVYMAILLVLLHFINVGQVFASNGWLVGAVVLACIALVYFRFRPKKSLPAFPSQRAPQTAGPK